MKLRSIALNLLIILSAYQGTVLINLPFYYGVLLATTLVSIAALMHSYPAHTVPPYYGDKKGSIINNVATLMSLVAVIGIISPFLSILGFAALLTDPIDASGRLILMLLQIATFYSLCTIYRYLPFNLIVEESRLSFVFLTSLVAILLLDFVLNNIFGIEFNLGGRSSIHGALRDSSYISSRAVGLFREPAYAVSTLLVWFWLATLRTKSFVKSFAIYISAVICTFSLGNYLVLLSGILSFIRPRPTWRLSYSMLRFSLLIIIISTLVTTFVPVLFDAMYSIVFIRVFEYDSFGGVDANIRTGLPLFLFVKWLDSSYLFNMLFGFGHQSVYYLGKTSLNTSIFDFGTSNNLIADGIYEVGLAGVIVYAILFVILLRCSFRLSYYRRALNLARLDASSKRLLDLRLVASNFVLFGLAVSSMLNANWASPSFYTLLFLFLMGYYHSSSLVEGSLNE